MDHLESSLINRFFEEYQDNTRMHMRVLLFRVFSVIPLYSFFKGRLRVGGENPLSANSVRVFEHVSTTKTTHSTSILRSSFAASAFRDAFFVHCSRILFGYFSKKSTFLKIPFPCPFPFSLVLKTKEEPRMNQGTPKERPTTQKCFLLR